MKKDHHTDQGAPGSRGPRSWLPAWALSNRTAAAALISAVAIAFFTTWFLMSPLVERVDRTVLMTMIIANIVIALSFAILVAVRLWHVLAERHHQLAGSQTHIQLVGIFSLLAVVPAAIAFLFAFSILRASLNDVFSERIEDYQNTARDLANGLVETRASELRQQISLIAQDIMRQEEAGVGFEQTPISFRRYLLAQAQIRGLAGLLLLDGEGRVLVKIDAAKPEFNLPSASALASLRDNQAPGGKFLFGVNDDATLNMFRGVMPIERYGGGYIIAYQAIDETTTRRLFAVSAVRDDWREAEASRGRLERVFLAGYIVLAIIILFGAIWIAIWAATRLVQPIGRLINMAERVSAGELDARVDVSKDDGELGVLARSMNHMTGQLQSQRNDLIDTNEQLDNRRRFTEAVLSGVSAGVLGIDNDGTITLANSSANALLHDRVKTLAGENVHNILPEFSQLIDGLQSGGADEISSQIDMPVRDEVRSFNVRIVGDSVEGSNSCVVTFDDITQLISAQRNAAWGDVARRIAHEIKNPLTPIQLSAERLQRKYSSEITSSPDIFEKCTETIIRQVNDIGRMVDEFSSFARMPKPIMSVENLDELIKSAVFPQKVAFEEIDFQIDMPTPEPFVYCDGRLIVQAISNLLKNAAESVDARYADDPDSMPGIVKVQVVVQDEQASINIIDNGLGLPAKERHRLAEPYMTTRAKGTGLGLAIVKKVAEEHEGRLSFEDDTSLGAASGARVSISLPLAVPASSEQTTAAE